MPESWPAFSRACSGVRWESALPGILYGPFCSRPVWECTARHRPSSAAQRCRPIRVVPASIDLQLSHVASVVSRCVSRFPARSCSLPAAEPSRDEPEARPKVRGRDRNHNLGRDREKEEREGGRQTGRQADRLSGTNSTSAESQSILSLNGGGGGGLHYGPRSRLVSACRHVWKHDGEQADCRATRRAGLVT